MNHRRPHHPALALGFCLWTGLGCESSGQESSQDTAAPAPEDVVSAARIEVGERPRRLAAGLADGSLRDALLACDDSTIGRQPFSIGHRGAPLGYPEHTRESYLAAAQQGAGAIECDVTFTSDGELVCRHSQCDLHTTSNILETPLADSCSVAPDPSAARPFANVQCCTSDVTLAQFQTLQGRHDAVDEEAMTLADYYAPGARAPLPGGPERGTLMTHAQSITLFDELGVAMVPELKRTEQPVGLVDAPSRDALADKLVAAYLAAGIDPARVSIQSFSQADLDHWRRTAPAFAPGLILLDDRYRDESFDPLDAASWEPTMQVLVEQGLRTLAPPMWVLLTLDDNGTIVPSPYAIAARAAGLDLVSWTLERSGSLEDGGGFYYQSIQEAINVESDMLVVLDVLATEVGVRSMFADWPATTTWYAHCVPSVAGTD